MISIPYGKGPIITHILLVSFLYLFFWGGWGGGGVLSRTLLKPVQIIVKNWKNAPYATFLSIMNLIVVPRLPRLLMTALIELVAEAESPSETEACDTEVVAES